MKLNDRQRIFADLVYSGRPAGRAYEEAGYSAKGNSADSCAERLLRNVEIIRTLESLRESARKASQFTTKAKLDMLFKIAVAQKDEDPRVAIAAIAEDNRMTGGYAPGKVKVSELDSFFVSIQPKEGLCNED